MAVYLDTSVLPIDGDLDSAPMQFLRQIVAPRQALILTDLVVEEATHVLYRRAKALLDEVQVRVGKLERINRASVRFECESAASIAQAWRAELEQNFEVIPTQPTAAVEALTRRARRIRPAHRESEDARDAAIWLTVCADHQVSGQESWFVSNNTHDYSEDPSKAKDSLHPDLVADIAPGVPLHFVTSIDALLRVFGTRVRMDTEWEQSLRDYVAGEAGVFFFTSEPVVAQMRNLVATKGHSTELLATSSLGADTVEFLKTPWAFATPGSYGSRTFISIQVRLKGTVSAFVITHDTVPSDQQELRFRVSGAVQLFGLRWSTHFVADVTQIVEPIQVVPTG
jgi:hypothetical protein